MQADISIIDSKDDSKVAYVIVGQCSVKVEKIKLKDACYIVKIVGNVCHLELDTTYCAEAR